MRHLIRPVVAAAAVALVAVAGCGGTSASPKACKAAMRHELQHAFSNPSASPGTRPAACKGISDAELRKLAGQLLTGG